MLLRGNYLLSSVATDGKDENGLKLEIAALKNRENVLCMRLLFLEKLIDIFSILEEQFVYKKKCNIPMTVPL